MTKKHNFTLQLCNNDVKQVSCCKYLGVYVDDQLNWKNHIEYVHKKLLKFVSIFYKLRHKVNSQILQTVYFSFIYPHLLYGIEVYANTKKSFLKGLIILNNKLLRTLQQQTLRTHTVELYKNYNTLTIPDLHDYQLCNLVHKFLYKDKLPPAYSNYFTQNYAVHNYCTKNRNDLHLQSCQTAIGKKIIKFKASQLWNLLPNDLKQIQSYNSFKSRLKIYINSKSN